VRVREAQLPGVRVVEPQSVGDERGFFVRTLDVDVLREAGLEPDDFVQQSQSRSNRHVVRGLHLRAAPGEAKLVRCARGRVFDVVVDLRPWSRAFGRWESFLLDDEQPQQVYVPAGFAHGFQVLSDRRGRLLPPRRRGTTRPVRLLWPGTTPRSASCGRTRRVR
jgi:dTDP-4-dehydrorhamnose 3,5-epimerase